MSEIYAMIEEESGWVFDLKLGMRSDHSHDGG
jgi:hypothetical protein